MRADPGVAGRLLAQGLRCEACRFVLEVLRQARWRPQAGLRVPGPALGAASRSRSSCSTWRARAPLRLRRSPSPAGAESAVAGFFRSEEHTSELQSLMRTSYAVFCLKKKK